MRILLLSFIIIASFSCKSKDSKENKSTTDTTSNTSTDTSKPAEASVTKKLIFERYEEGDYPHLVFKEAEGTESYDFGHPTENVLSGTTLVIADTTTSFGFRQNGDAVGKTYTVTMVKKIVDGYDGNGQPMKVEGWRITSISL